MDGQNIIIEVDSNTGEPLLLAKNAKKFTNHCGFLVRDKLPISTHEWKMKKDDPRISFVSEREKDDFLWDLVTAHFQLPGGEDLKKLVKSWALKKMAT